MKKTFIKMKEFNLLKPRYEVISDFPGSTYHVGEIVQCLESNTEHFRWPTIFRQLEWWEKRKENELPRYIKTNGGAWGLYKGVFKVQCYEQADHEPKSDVDNIFVMLEGKFDRSYRLRICEPATEKEYGDYIKEYDDYIKSIK